MDNKDQTLRRFVGAIIILVCVVVAYWPTLHAGFIWDDDAYVTGNLALRTLDGLRRIWTEPGTVPQYYPLTHTTFWLEYHVWGLAPTGYHVANLLLHAANSLLLWTLLHRLRVPGAFLAATVFAVHPINVESVAWVTERKNVLSGFFYLASGAVYLSVFELEAPSEQRRSHFLLSGLALLLFACALLSKSVTATLPCVIALLIVWKRGRIGLRELALLAPAFVLGIVLSLQTVVMEKSHVGAVGKDWELSLAEHLLVAGRIFWFYLGKLAWPTEVLFIYPRWILDPLQCWQWSFPMAAGLLMVLLLVGHRLVGAGPLVAALYYVGTLVPALGFFSVYPMRFSFVANHFVYLATIGPIALAASVGANLAARVSAAAHKALLVGTTVLVLILVVLSNREALNYRDQLTLWMSAIAGNPECFLCYDNVGNILANSGRPLEAIAHYEEAIRLAPDFPDSYNDLAWLRATDPETQNRSGAEAIRLSKQAIQMAEGENPNFLDTLAAAYAEDGQFSAAIRTAERALRLASASRRHSMADQIRIRLEGYQAWQPFHRNRDAARSRPPDRAVVVP